MRNKILLVSACALGLSSVAFAGGLPEAMPPAPVAMTSDTGVYLGLEGGYGMTNWKNLSDLYKVERDNGLVGRAFVGYDINKYFAIEGGFTHFFLKRTNILDREDKVGFHVRTQAVDLEGKIKAPITDEFSLYGKLGVDYLMSNVKADKGIKVSSRNNFNVLFGAGADYAVTQNIIINAEWMRYNGDAKFTADKGEDFSKKYQPNADVFMIGVRYKFDL